MAINTGVNCTKLVAYAVLAPSVGINTTKLVTYAVLAPPIGVDCTKLVSYAVLSSTNVTPPIWPTFTFPTGYVTASYSQDWDMPSSAITITYSVLSGTLPPGLTLSALTGNKAKLSGVLTTAGTYSFTLRAVNTYGTADRDFTILVLPASTISSGGSYAYIC